MTANVAPQIKNFRQDINGLRAWAVIAVVLYHFGIPGFQGGFVGVDVFYVISGFLMTQIIVKGLEQGPGRKPFSIWDFYLARARRIIPALAILCAVLLVVGYFALSTSDYRQLGQHAASALLFVSNIKFALESGYFDAASHDKWLLHTWSLAVEWQFYLLLPLVLALVWRFWPRREALQWVVVAGFVLSLALSIYLTPLRSSAAFYLLPTRAWEMLAGGLVFFFGNRFAFSKIQCRGIDAVGFVLILASILFISSRQLWPGAWAAVPVLGSALVLLAGQQQSLWTSTRVAQWLGNASYSIYLWHWPVVVALVYLGMFGNPVATVLGILASVLLGYASLVWVEQPTRKRMVRLKWPGNLAAIALFAGIVLVPSAMAIRNVWPDRIKPEIEAVFDEAQNTDPRVNKCANMASAGNDGCSFGGKDLGAIMLGDSHASPLLPTVGDVLAASDEHVRAWTYHGCASVEAVHYLDRRIDQRCRASLQFVMQAQAEKKGVPIIIVNRSAQYVYGKGNELEGQTKPEVYVSPRTSVASASLVSEFKTAYVDTVCKLAESHPVYLVRPIPEMGANVPKTMGRSLLLGNPRRVSVTMEAYMKRDRFIWDAQDEAAEHCDAKVFDPLPYLCKDGRCWGDQQGLPIYSDDNHLNKRGAALLRPMFEAMLQ